jgi:cytochrome c biogenesis protein CcmG/thiol:disulfide interchange protein DsbE
MRSSRRQRNGFCARPDMKVSLYRRRALAGSAFWAIGLSLMGALPVATRANALKVGTPAPPLTLKTLDGKTISTADLLGQVVVVTFWATWCEPCHEELPILSRYFDQHRHQGLTVLGFSLDDPSDLAAVQKVAEQLAFPVGLLGSQYAGGYGRVWRLPVSFVIDRQGRLVDDGWRDDQPAWTEGRLEAVLGPYLTRTTQSG